MLPRRRTDTDIHNLIRSWCISISPLASLTLFSSSVNIQWWSVRSVSSAFCDSPRGTLSLSVCWDGRACIGARGAEKFSNIINRLDHRVCIACLEPPLMRYFYGPCVHMYVPCCVYHIILCVVSLSQSVCVCVCMHLCHMCLCSSTLSVIYLMN